MNKVIFVNRYFYPDHSATSQLLTDVAFDLASHGWDVYVITSRQVYDHAQSKLPAAEVINGVNVKRIATSRFGRDGLSGRAFDYLTFHMAAAWYLAAIVGRDDLIVAETDPPLVSVVAALVARVRGAILMNWMQDIFPEVASALGVKGLRLVEPGLRALRNYSLRMAKSNVVLAESMAGRLAKLGADPSTIKVIHNWADGELITPLEHNANRLRKEWNVEHRFVVGYSGNMGRAHEFDTIIDAAELLKNDDKITFLFIGGGAQQQFLEREAEKRHLNNLVFKPYQLRETLGLSLCVPDVHLISLRPELEGLVVPSKFYGIAAAARPTLYIGDPDGAVPRVLSEEKCGLTIKIGEAERLAAQIKQLESDRAQVHQLGLNARNAFDARFDKALALQAWRALVSGIFQSETGLGQHPA